MSNAGVTSQSKICLCGVPYEARYARLFGHVMEITGGLCPECRHQKRAEMRQTQEKVRHEQVDNTRKRWRDTCGIPSLFKGERFGTFLQRREGNIDKVKQICQQYAAGFPVVKTQGYHTLILFSQLVWGVGKTHLVCSIAHEILDRWDGESPVCPVYFVTEPDLFLRVQDTFNLPDHLRGLHETERDVYRQLASVPLLIIDDVGKEERNDPRFVQKVMFAIIDGRYRRRLPMVITSNLSQEALLGHFGAGHGNEAAAERLVEMCGGKFWEVTGTSYRFIKVGK